MIYAMGDTNGAAAEAAAAGEEGMEGQQLNSAESASGTSTISRRTGAHGEDRLQVRV